MDLEFARRIRAAVGKANADPRDCTLRNDGQPLHASKRSLLPFGCCGLLRAGGRAVLGGGARLIMIAIALPENGDDILSCRRAEVVGSAPPIESSAPSFGEFCNAFRQPLDFARVVRRGVDGNEHNLSQ